MEGGLAVAGHPVQDLLVGLDRPARRELAAVERRERRLGEDRPRRADHLHPLPTVLPVDR